MLGFGDGELDVLYGLSELDHFVQLLDGTLYGPVLFERFSGGKNKKDDGADVDTDGDEIEDLRHYP